MTKIDETKIDDAKDDLELVMLMYNLLEYSSNYSDVIGSKLLYSTDEATDFDANIENNHNFKCLMSG